MFELNAVAKMLKYSATFSMIQNDDESFLIIVLKFNGYINDVIEVMYVAYTSKPITINRLIS